MAQGELKVTTQGEADTQPARKVVMGEGLLANCAAGAVASFKVAGAGAMLNPEQEETK